MQSHGQHLLVSMSRGESCMLAISAEDFCNDLGIEPVGGNGSRDVGAIANALPVIVDGHHVYGVSVQAGVGYRNDVTRGVPTGAQPQGAYMVTSGHHTDAVCCFDF